MIMDDAYRSVGRNMLFLNMHIISYFITYFILMLLESAGYNDYICHENFNKIPND